MDDVNDISLEDLPRVTGTPLSQFAAELEDFKPTVCHLSLRKMII